LGERAGYVTSVCTGSLILAAAGLIQGKRAACHWAWRSLLAESGVIADAGRVVRDGNLITGGGVTAGIDFGLVLIAELAGQDTAEAVQLAIEYDPEPPFASGSPEQAPAAVRERIEQQVALLYAERREAMSAARSRPVRTTH
jgi:transcriptional regulator GlxA family with amidase domain